MDVLRRRPVSGQAPPTGGEYPYVSQEGHNIIDVRFGELAAFLGYVVTGAARRTFEAGRRGVQLQGHL